MDEEAQCEVCQGVVVAAPALLQREPVNRYGSVPGLDDEELADPWELERCALGAEWEPVMRLPGHGSRSSIRPAVNEDGALDWGAFGTVDFDRHRPAQDGQRHRLQALKASLREALIMLSIVTARLPGGAKYEVLKHLRMGVIDMGHIAGEDMQAMAKWWLRAERLRQEVRRVEETRARRRVLVTL